MDQQRPDSRASQRRHILAIVFVAIWLLLAGSGTIALLARESRAAERATTHDTWPAHSRLARETGKSTLLVFVHPNCPCTRASVLQLTQVLSELPAASRPRVIVVARPAAGEDWRVRWLTALAKAIPEAQLVEDAGSVEAKRFGALTSGHVLLYAADGTLRFDGGVTLGRGHQGRNDAAEKLRRELALPEGKPSQTAVFGCAIEPRNGRSGT